MIKTVRILYLALILSNYCNAQVTWEKLFVQSNTDVFRSIQEVPSGGYIAAGYTSRWSINDSDAYVVRLSVLGDTLWTRTFNGGKVDAFYKVINTADGGFVMCGYTSSYSTMGDQDAFYMKLDANGNELWRFTFGYSNTKERAQDIIQTSDGGFAMVGYTNNGQPSYNSFLVKINSNGGQTWVKKYGGATTYDDANSIKELPDGGFILAGQTVITTWSGQIFLVRTNSNGDTLWTKSFGTDTTGKNENAESIQLTNNGFIICGSTDSTGSDDGYLVKTDTGGVVQWAKIFGGTSNDDFHMVENTSDSGYILTGTTQSNLAIISNIWLFKTDVNGDSSWAYTFGKDNHDHGYSGVQTTDGGYILCGYTASFGFNYEDALVIKVDGNGLLYNHLIYTTVTALVSPVNGSCGSANTVVTITVRNFGDTAVSTFPDTVIISGAINQTLGQTFTGTIVPPNFTNHTFTTTINTLAGGVFNFHCFTSNNNDVYPAMNWRDSTITINAAATPPVAVGDTTCGPGMVTLTASSPFTLDWFSNSTGGISLGSGVSYTTSISNTTTFYVQASNGCGTSSRTAVTAYVFPVTPPPSVFSAQRCGPGNVTLLASSGNPISWWDSASGGTMLQGNLNSYVANVTVTTTFYVEAGTGGFCPSSRVPVTATVIPLPIAAFTPSATAVCLGDSFMFTNSSTGAVAYSWDFGDGTGTSVQTDPTYSYSQTGPFSVQLIAVSDSNCYDTTTVIVNVNTAPLVNFSVASTTGCAPFTVSFLNSTTNATDYLWSFGDGAATSTLENPTYTYNVAGTYTVSLNASVGSCADADTLIDYIVVNPSPVAGFTATNTCLGNVIDFINSSAGAVSYAWDFGDGIGNSTLSNPSYQYLSANTFTVTLIASDGICTDTLINYIEVYPSPVAGFTATNTCLGTVIDFTNSSAGAVSYAWDFGDGIGNSTLSNPSYQYLSVNTFTVTLIASAGICTDTFIQAVTVFAPPVFDFGPDITTNSVTYLLDAGSGFTGYLWNNGSTSQSITADTNGLYCLIVTDINTCSDTDCVYVALDAAGIINTSGENNFIIYPNPAQNSLTIFISKVDASKICDLRIYDAVGREIFRDRITDEIVNITTANWPRGIYSAEIKSETYSIRKKLILY